MTNLQYYNPLGSIIIILVDLFDVSFTEDNETIPINRNAAIPHRFPELNKVNKQAFFFLPPQIPNIPSPIKATPSK